MDPTVSRALSGARQLVALLAAQRLANFALNQLLIRHVSPEVLGLTTIRLELLLSTVLFLSREGFRLALVRSEAAIVVSEEGAAPDARQRVAQQQLINTAWLPVPLGFALALVVVAAAPRVLGTASEAGAAAPARAYALYCGAAALETLAEPLFIVAQAHMWTGLRVSTEAAATLARSALSFGLLVAVGMDGGDAFGFAQLGYTPRPAGRVRAAAGGSSRFARG